MVSGEATGFASPRGGERCVRGAGGVPASCPWERAGGQRPAAVGACSAGRRLRAPLLTEEEREEGRSAGGSPARRGPARSLAGWLARRPGAVRASPRCGAVLQRGGGAGGSGRERRAGAGAGAGAGSSQAQPNTDWRFSQTQRPGTSGSQNGEEGGAWPNNQFDTEMLQAMILASANEAADGNSTLGGGTGTMGLSARYGPQFTLQHVPDYRQNVYIPGSTATLTNAAGKRDAKSASSSGGNKKKSGKKEKK
ncbi:uncharacterized protein LJ206_015609 isoform 12-T12 [Theristicus caerulescens]